MKRFRGLRALAGLLQLAGLAAALGVSALAWFGRPVDSLPAEGLIFSLQAGETASAAALRLEREGALRSSLVFRVLARLQGREGRLQTGNYRVTPGMDAAALLDLLVSGRQILERVTIPEGSTLAETAVILADAGICEAASFTEAARDAGIRGELGIEAADLEGWLFPDTYFMPRDYPAGEVVRTMVAALRSHLAEIPGSAGLSPRMIADKITLASIVEREYRVPDEAPLIAGVFENRLKIGMALQSCATVAYVITERLGKAHPSVIYDRDLKLPDPYNTYAHPGLPPGPICSPGMTALQAAFSPARSSSLYFRLVDEAAGRHFFSATLDQHLKAAGLFVKRSGGP